MKIFIDTADLDEIKMACSWGIVDGATTNPSLIKRAVDKREGKVTMEEYIPEIVKTVPGPVSLEVIAVREKEMVKQAKFLYKKFSPYGKIAIKIPINTCIDKGGDEFEGLKAIKQLSEEGIPVNCTLCFTPTQALLAAKAGAVYISPFAGRLDDYVRQNIGMKSGVDFGRDDYYDSDLMKLILKREASLKEKALISQLYVDLTKGSAAAQDSGVYGGVELVKKIVTIYKNYGYKTEVLAASIRNLRQVMDVAEAGAHVATIPFNVLNEMIRHPKTVEGIKSFTADIVPAYAKLFEKI